ncbi:MAG TPA: tRNA (adenosine(37)-N6)-threonylcarbamoyltransferase complex ATPase subunit type 1 TsaE [Candidatus Binataceae bacterium]|nr:tRNA (adenosine(37)-N6)-threonylcarbamoyltransferase complex ATPase subunit type 1 TsaE [Candidatus Binataceae bacterium]
MTEAPTESSADEIILIVETNSARETKGWGRRLGSLLEGGELLGFTGELGAGKTCFIKGLARGLSLREEDILSPTFTMIQEHHGRLPLYHIDLYRLEAPVLDDLGLREYLFSSAVAAVEWFERLREAPELEFLSVRIEYTGASTRRLEFRATGDRHAAIVSKLKHRFA